MRRLLLSAAAILVLAAPLAAQADSGQGKGHSQGKVKGHSAGADAKGWTPPGLAKKPHGMPPGQAKKIWGQGDQLPATYNTTRYAVSEPYRRNLPPAPYGQRWVQVGDQYYLAQTKSGVISQVLSALAR